MLLRSGRTYHSNLLDMEGKLDLILKEPQDLRFRVKVLENKKALEMIPKIEKRRISIDIGKAKMT